MHLQPQKPAAIQKPATECGCEVFQSSSWWPSHDEKRLIRTIHTYEVKLGRLISQFDEADQPWVAHVRSHFEMAKENARRGNIDSAWHSLKAARHSSFFGFSDEERLAVAICLREESEKMSKWREKAIKRLLDNDDNPPLAVNLISAYKLRDEYVENKYYKIELMQGQLMSLVWTIAIATAVLLPFILFRNTPLFKPLSTGQWNNGVIAAALLFGLLGASFSAAQSFIADSGGNIPEKISNNLVTIIRTLSGLISGLAGYVFYKSQILQISLGTSGTATALAIAFIFGYGGEHLIAQVSRVIASPKSDSSKS